LLTAGVLLFGFRSSLGGFSLAMSTPAADGPACSNHGSEYSGRLRRAAALQDSAKFAALLEASGWRGSRLDECADSSNKNPLHLAAWRGSVANVRLLLERGSNLESLSTGPHNYGKTPLFYAITRCRDEVVQVLLEAKASAKVVNNKGQTPLSLAFSHLEAASIAAIQAREEEEGEAAPWRNFY
ncbi:unnamed protein product, partial [Polarella glacialis]